MAVQDVVLVAGPALDPVTLDDLKAHLKVDDPGEDRLLQIYLNAVVGHLDGWHGTLSRCLVEQTWALHLCGFPRCRIELPLQPLIAVDSITYLDGDGASQTLDQSAYQVLDGEVAAIDPAYGSSWPFARFVARSVTITFRAGYAVVGEGEDAKPDLALIPANIISSILMLTSDLNENRDAKTITPGTVTVVENDLVKSFLTPFRPQRI